MAVERFCTVLALRLDREERELFPIARGAIGGEAWFAVGQQMLAHEAYRAEHRGRTPPAASRAARAEHGQRQSLHTATMH